MYRIDVSDFYDFQAFRNMCPFRDYNKAVENLKRLVIYVDSAPECYVMKEWDVVFNKPRATIVSEQECRQKLKKIKVVQVGMKMLDAWDILLSKLERFFSSWYKFYTPSPNFYSIFTGYKYEQVEWKENIIEAWLDHVKEIICNGNEKVYEYILCWFANILQHPSAKNETALIIIGKQGTGKNTFFTDILCKLLEGYSNPNMTNLENICGKFNSSIENMKLIVCNELQSIDTTKVLNSDALKSLITDKVGVVERKYKDQRVCENVANFIMVSNNVVPMKLESSDRRYVVVRTSDSHMQDTEYFDDLAETLTPNFYNHLFSYFMTLDISKFNPRQIPHTEERQTLLEANKSVYELFIDETNF
ncbi:hypothetical protein TVAGG3_0933010, partial [Trichomonas vaginalis G3]|uniref:hypothetical protein n=1 Tax=Trichomonas vaginalis (strain ATCC PRA-98 / G3) TaxID=412133 RepID=UPI0021E5D14C